MNEIDFSIRERFHGNRVEHAFDGVNLDFAADGVEMKNVRVIVVRNLFALCTFSASGFSVKFDGYTVLYKSADDENEENESVLPDMKKADVLKFKELLPEQHFTQ